MPKREGHILIGFNCDPELRGKIIRAAAPFTVSQFLRNVIVRELMSMGIAVDPALAAAPSREGVGGGRSRAESMALRAAESCPGPAVVAAQKPVNYKAKRAGRE